MCAVTEIYIKNNYCKMSIAEKTRKKEKNEEKRRKLYDKFTFNIQKKAEKWQ